MVATIRWVTSEDRALLDHFLRLAVFVPQGEPEPDDSIVTEPGLRAYVEDFGRRAGDRGVIATRNGDTVGAAWARVFPDGTEVYGRLDDQTPVLAMAVEAGSRGNGIGTLMLRSLMSQLADDGYECLSLSVQSDNSVAVALYTSHGFEVVDQSDGELVMVTALTGR